MYETDIWSHRYRDTDLLDWHGRIISSIATIWNSKILISYLLYLIFRMSIRVCLHVRSYHKFAFPISLFAFLLRDEMWICRDDLSLNSHGCVSKWRICILWKIIFNKFGPLNKLLSINSHVIHCTTVSTFPLTPRLRVVYVDPDLSQTMGATVDQATSVFLAVAFLLTQVQLYSLHIRGLL